MPGSSVGYVAAIMKSKITSRHEFGALRLFLTATALTIMVSACAPIIISRGNLPAPELLSTIQPGSHTRNQIADILGSPSSVATFDDEVWYYISSQTETFAFYEPILIDQQVIAISFDEAGKVKEVRRYGLDDARAIEPVDRTTPTGGREITVLEQLFGNIGKFSTAGQ